MRCLCGLAQTRLTQTILCRSLDRHRQAEIFLGAPAFANRAAAFERGAAARTGQAAGLGKGWAAHVPIMDVYAARGKPSLLDDHLGSDRHACEQVGDLVVDEAEAAG